MRSKNATIKTTQNKNNFTLHKTFIVGRQNYGLTEQSLRRLHELKVKTSCNYSVYCWEQVENYFRAVSKFETGL